MTPTQKMQEIEASRQRLLENQTSKLSIKLINEVADELHEAEVEKYQILNSPAHVGDVAKELLKRIQEIANFNK
jgi:hypothetical protein